MYMSCVKYVIFNLLAKAFSLELLLCILDLWAAQTQSLQLNFRVM